MEKGYTIAELSKILGKTPNNLRVIAHKRGILPISVNPNRYRLEDFQQTKRGYNKIERLQKRIIELEAQLAAKDEIIKNYFKRLNR